MTLCPRWWHKDRHPVLLTVVCELGKLELLRSGNLFQRSGITQICSNWCCALWVASLALLLGTNPWTFLWHGEGCTSLCLTGLHSYIGGAAAATIFFFFGCFSCSVLLCNSRCLPVPHLLCIHTQTVIAVFSALPVAVEVDHWMTVAFHLPLWSFLSCYLSFSCQHAW